MQISKSEWILQVNQKLNFGSFGIWHKKRQSNTTIQYCMKIVICVFFGHYKPISMRWKLIICKLLTCYWILGWNLHLASYFCSWPIFKYNIVIRFLSEFCSDDLERNRSRSLEPLSGLAMWSDRVEYIQLQKEDRGLGFSILDYLVSVVSFCRLYDLF